MTKKNEDAIKEKDECIEDLNNQLDEVQQFKKQEKEMREQIEKLSKDYQNENQRRIHEGIEKDRDKITATEKLRKEMLYQIKKTKANLLALNDEQLQTTTRLTILQNSQLTTELEHQSK